MNPVRPEFEIARRWPLFLLAGATLCLQSAISAPHAVWPLGFVCLVPWAIAVCTSRRPKLLHLISYLLGAAFFLWNLRWLRFSTMPGYVALALWSGVYYLLASWGIRHGYRVRRIPLTILVPVVWLTTEYARSHGPLAFPWFLLGHSQYRILTMIQIADLVGAYGPSFVLAVVNGCIADLVIEGVLGGRARAAVGGKAACDAGTKRRLVSASVFALLLLAGTIAYGRFRLAEGRFTVGPKVAVLQGDYVLLPESPETPSASEKRETYLSLLREAAAEDPDLFLLPETPWSMYLNREARALNPGNPLVAFSRECHEVFRQTVERENAYIVVGSVSHHAYPTNVYPKYERFNSAFVYAPGESEPMRYDKIHLVLFGEYVPFRYGRLHWLYRWLNSLTPWGAGDVEYSLTAGTLHRIFRMRAPSQENRGYRFAVPICYEDVIPGLIREFVTGPDGRKRVDFLLNISNDGWFHHTAELPQHMALCAFRAIENRVGFARAVNTGVSGFIDPDGRIRDVVEEPGRKPWEGITGYRVSRIMLDARHTLYSRLGDWFVTGCAMLGLVCLIDALVARIRANWA